MDGNSYSGIPHEQAVRQFSQQIIELAKNEHYDRWNASCYPPPTTRKQLEKMFRLQLWTEAGHIQHYKKLSLETSNIDALRFAKDEVKERKCSRYLQR